MQNLAQKLKRPVLPFLIVFGLIAGVIINRTFAPGKVHSYVNDLVVYDEGLSSGWANWSWGADVNLDRTDGAYSGAKTMGFVPNAWGGLFLHNDSVQDISGYDKINFAVRASSNNTKLRLLEYDLSDQLNQKILSLENYGSLKANEWVTFSIPVGDLPLTKFKGLAFQEGAGINPGLILIDSLGFSKLSSMDNNSQTAVAEVNLNTSTITIFNGGLADGWSNWSWGSAVNMNQVIEFSANQPWAGLFLKSKQNLTIPGTDKLQFSLRATETGQKYQVGLMDSNNKPIANFVAMESFGGAPVANTWINYAIDISAINPGNKPVAGVVIQEALGKAQARVDVDKLIFTGGSGAVSTPVLTVTPNISPTASPALTQYTVTPTPVPIQTTNNMGGRYTTQGGRIYKDGSQIKLKGVNWFGFETGTYAPHGLWARNWKDMISQIKALGFNAVRLPFCPTTLRDVATTGIDAALNPDLNGLTSMQVMDKIVGELNNQKLYVLLDHHSPNCQNITALWYTGDYSESQWINDLSNLGGRYKNMEYVMGMDLKNEPHDQASWGTGDAGTDWKMAAEKAGKAVLSANPNMVVFVEGVQTTGNCGGYTSSWMGGDLAGVKCFPVTTAAVPANKLVLSPHVYGPDVYMQSYFTDGSFPGNMPAIWDAHFGYLTGNGYTLVPGEWGGRMGTGGGSGLDMTLQQSLTKYLGSKGICSSFYWSWNPNSGDTGGILQDDWKTVWYQKMDVLNNYWNSCN